LQDEQEELVLKKPEGPKTVNIEDIINMPGRLKRPSKVSTCVEAILMLLKVSIQYLVILCFYFSFKT